MRGRSQVGQTEAVAGEPIPGPHQPADIGQMIADIVTRGPQSICVWRSTALILRHMAFERPFGHQGAAHLAVELVVEPAGEPTDLDPLRGTLRQETVLRLIRLAVRECLFDVFRNDAGTRNWRFSFVHQYGELTGGVEQQEFLATLPESFFD